METNIPNSNRNDVVLALFLVFFMSWASGSNCPRDKFGWQCRYNCSCNGACDNVTGFCEDCPGMAWGPGCLLDSKCTYNDTQGSQYQGKRSTEDQGRTCIPWYPPKRGFTGDGFPEKDLRKASNYCRNPFLKHAASYSKSPWCYFNRALKWSWCTINSCDCPKGRFGTNCLSECHCNDQDNTCASDSGECIGGDCHDHFQGPSCKDCNKRFGVHCDKTCRCQNPEETCNRTTGSCTSGCSAGWIGIDCHTECAPGKYGLNCANDCSRNCDPPGQCDKGLGTCPCQIGYQPPRCMQECAQGKYGLNCVNDCSKNCDLPSQCDKRSGTCRCQVGFQPPLCDTGCAPGKFGLNCTNECSKNCDTPGECDKKAGTCPCQIGYMSPLCLDECAHGKYGPNCTNDCSRNCDPPNRCDKKSGVCACVAGYQPPLCVKACEDGKFGKNCSFTCNCLNRTEACEKMNGLCTMSGCPKGWYGPACLNEYRENQFYVAAWVIAALFATLFVITLFALVVMVFKFRRYYP